MYIHINYVKLYKTSPHDIVTTIDIQGSLQLGFFGGSPKENFTPSKKNLHSPKNIMIIMKKNISGANSIVTITDFDKNVHFKQLQHSFWIVLETITG